VREIESEEVNWTEINRSGQNSMARFVNAAMNHKGSEFLTG
jgi:hypothetical protein